MTSVFDKWNKEIDGEALAKDVKDVKANGGNGEYKEVPLGVYEVSIEKLELKESKAGNPMVAVWFKVLEGEYKDSLIFMNQVVNQAFQIHIANEFLRSLGTGKEIEFDGNYNAYNTSILDIAEAVDGNFEYLLDYSQNKKGFSQFKIQEVFEVE